MIGAARILAVVFGLGLAPSAAPAGDSGAGLLGDFHVQVTPYLWMAGLEGDVATFSNLPKVDVDASFDDILDHTDLAFMMTAEVRYRRVGFLADLTYLDLSADGDTPGPFFSRVDLETETFTTTLGPYLRVLDWERVALDVLGGIRLWDVDSELQFKPGLVPREIDIDDDETWVDPVIGARAGVRLLGPLYVSAAGDIGGFGAASELTWQVLGTVDFRPFRWLVLRAGYRHLDVDYDHGGFVWDVALSGPILGVGIRF